MALLESGFGFIASSMGKDAIISTGFDFPGYHVLNRVLCELVRKSKQTNKQTNKKNMDVGRIYG